jgi:hypothetical protein
MELSDVFGGPTLKADDLKGTEPTVTIAKVEMVEFDKKKKLVISFVGKTKVLICNKTNANRIAFVNGSNTDKWIGKKIQLYSDIVDFQGKAVEALRVRPIKPTPAAAAPGPDFDDPVADVGKPLEETF